MYKDRAAGDLDELFLNDTTDPAATAGRRDNGDVHENLSTKDTKDTKISLVALRVLRVLRG
jgi:hypothetical protein